MHILNRVIAAGALVVPMTLGTAGIAMADVAAGSPTLPSQVTASTDRNPDSCRHDDGGLLGGLLGRGGNESPGAFGSRNDSSATGPGDSECRPDGNGGQDNFGGQGNNGPLG